MVDNVWMFSRFVHPVKGDRDGALHFCPGDLRQILGIEDEEISWSLGTRRRHNGEQDSCGNSRQQTALQHPWLSMSGQWNRLHDSFLCFNCYWHTGLPSSSSTPSGVCTNRGSEGYESGSCHTHVSLVFTFNLQICTEMREQVNKGTCFLSLSSWI